MATRLINDKDVDGFFVYGGSQQYRRADLWFTERVAASRRGQNCAVEDVSPEVAQILLQNNAGNRRVNARTLADYVRDMIGGRWELNGETFKVSREGLLNDAQHRCFGVLLSGVSIKAYVAFGLLRETMASVDVGRKRTAGDRLAVKGEGEYVAYSAISGLAFEIDNRRAGTAAEIDAYFTEHDVLVRLAHKVAGSNIRGLGPSIAGASSMHLLRLGAKEDDIKRFFKIVRTADALKNDAARTISDALNPKAPKQPLKQKKTEWVSTICHHFALWRKKKTTRAPIVGQPIPESI